MFRLDRTNLPRGDSSVPLMHRGPRNLGLIFLVKKRKIRFPILSDFFRRFKGLSLGEYILLCFR